MIDQNIKRTELLCDVKDNYHFGEKKKRIWSKVKNTTLTIRLSK